MTSSHRHLAWLGRLSCMGALCLAFGAGVLLAADAPVPKASPEQIELWAQQLDSESFTEREEATLALTKQGAAALDAVALQLHSNSLEATSRALHILQELAQVDDLDTQAAARDAIVAAAAEAGPMGRRLAVALAALNQKRSSKALMDLERLGVRVERRTDLLFNNPVFAIQQQQLQNQSFGLSLHVDEEFKGTLKDLRRLEWVENVQHVELVGEKIDDAVLAQAVKVPGLMSLHLYNTPQVSDRGLDVLLEMPTLRTLGIYYSPISDAAVPTLCKLNTLTGMKLYGTKITLGMRQQITAALPATPLDYRRGGFLGVGGLSSESELVVSTVHESSPAEKAGILPGDVLVSFDGKPLTQFDALTKLIAEHDVGATLAVVVRRSSVPDPINLEVTLARWDERQAIANPIR
ncbi:MAG: PDZ domain-containing protein [Pirellulales bacterium]